MINRKIFVTPVPKPRMTRRDKWKKRPCVVRYRQFCDDIKLHIQELPSAFRIVFRMPMPKSWSKKRKIASEGMPHDQTPDLDNLLKAVADAICEDDSFIWNVHAVKVWSVEGSIEIREIKMGKRGSKEV